MGALPVQAYLKSQQPPVTEGGRSIQGSADDLALDGTNSK